MIAMSPFAADRLAAALDHLAQADAAADRASSWLPWRARAAQRQCSEHLVLAIAAVIDAVHQHARYADPVPRR